MVFFVFLTILFCFFREGSEVDSEENRLRDFKEVGEGTTREVNDGLVANIVVEEKECGKEEVKG